MRDVSIQILLVSLFVLLVDSSTLSGSFTKQPNLQTMTAPSFLDSVPNIPNPPSSKENTNQGELSPFLRKQALSWRVMNNPDFSSSSIPKDEYLYYQEKYQISSYTELPFCVVIPTFNNKENNRAVRNILSVVMQNYTNYHIVVIDDGSIDGTMEIIEEFMKEQGKINEDQYKLETNLYHMGALFNIKKAAVEFCQPDDIFLVVDGDDELIGRQVLKVFNSIFSKNDIWFVYSNFIFGEASPGYSRELPQNIIEENSFRKYPFVTTHLRAFYTQLLRNIDDEDLLDQNGEYYKAANDVAISLPILEQCHTRVKYLPEVTYFYNNNTGENNHLIRNHQQRVNQRKIRERNAYQPVSKLLKEDY